MPLPVPKEGEQQKDFIARCARWMAENEDDRSQEQRLAICYSQWRRAKGEKLSESSMQHLALFTKPSFSK